MSPDLSRRSFLKALGAGGMLAALPGTAGARTLIGSEFEHPDGRVSLARVRADARDLVELASGFDLTEHGSGGWYDVVLWPGDRQRLREAGLEHRMLVADLADVDRRDRRAELEAAVAAGATGPIGGTYTYRFLEDHERDLAALAEQHPDIVHHLTLPHLTLEGRSVFGVEIGGPNVSRAREDGRPTSLIMGLHHAREWPSAELTMELAQDLVASYADGDPGIVELLDAIRVILIPVVNPDGYVRSRHLGAYDSVAPMPGAAALVGEFAYHRKNTRERPGQVAPYSPGMGVDPNRNYPYGWGGQPGASANPTSQVYHGPGPGSEPCVRNVLDLIRGEQILTLITNHTYSNLVLRPWGHTTRDAPDEAELRRLGDRMARHNGYRSQKGIQLYPTTGTTEDWSYGVTGGFGYTFEIGSAGLIGLGNTHPAEGAGFHPQYNLWIPEFYRLNRPAFLELLRAARDTTIHAVLEGRAPEGTVIELRKTATYELGRDHDGSWTNTEHLRSSMTVGPEGTFEWHVNPSPLPSTVTEVREGTLPDSAMEPYTIEAHLPDGATVTDTQVIRRGERIRFDVS